MNIDLGGKQELTCYRKIAIASWRHPRNPCTYSMLELPAAPAFEFLASCPSATPLTLTHYVTKIAAHCLALYPELNHVLRMGNLYKRNHVDIFITTLLKTGKGSDLSGFVIRDADRRPIAEIAAMTEARALDLRRNTDPENLKVQRFVNPLSSVALRAFLLVQEFLQFSLNMSLSALGIGNDLFGSAMVTNIGALGIDNAFIPLSPYSRCPLLIGVGKPKAAALVQGDKVVAGQAVTITFTFDHRYADGAHGSPMIRRFKKVFTNPGAYRSMFDGEGIGDGPR